MHGTMSLKNSYLANINKYYSLASEVLVNVVWATVHVKAIDSCQWLFVYANCVWPGCAHEGYSMVYCNLLKSIDLTNSEKACVNNCRRATPCSCTQNVNWYPNGVKIRHVTNILSKISKPQEPMFFMHFTHSLNSLTYVNRVLFKISWLVTFLNHKDRHVLW